LEKTLSREILGLSPYIKGAFYYAPFKISKKIYNKQLRLDKYHNYRFPTREAQFVRHLFISTTKKLPLEYQQTLEGAHQ
jgi:hypothetical protein